MFAYGLNTKEDLTYYLKFNGETVGTFQSIADNITDYTSAPMEKVDWFSLSMLRNKRGSVALQPEETEIPDWFNVFGYNLMMNYVDVESSDGSFVGSCDYLHYFDGKKGCEFTPEDDLKEFNLCWMSGKRLDRCEQLTSIC